MFPWFINPFIDNSYYNKVMQNGWLDWDNWFKTEINIAGNPALEKAIVGNIASYGTQLGVIIDALDEIINQLKTQGMDVSESGLRLQELKQAVDAIKKFGSHKYK